MFDNPDKEQPRKNAAAEPHIKFFKAQKHHFEAAKEQIAKGVSDTYGWMIKPRGSFENDGRLSGDPWWFTPPPTDNEILLEERGQTLRARTFEHGLLYMLKGLQAQGLFSAAAGKRIVGTATDSTTSVVVRELAKGRQAGPQHESMRTDDLKKLFKYTPRLKAAKLRDLRLVPLASLGLVTVRFDGQMYDVSVGPVGRAFYEEVYFPILKCMLPTINGEPQ